MSRIVLCYELCDIGGLQTWMLNLSRKYKELGHDCMLFYFKNGPFKALVPRQETVIIGDLSDLLRVVETQKIEIVHGAATDWSLGLSAVRRLGAKLIVTGHGRFQPCWNSSNCDALVGCSRWDAAAQQAWTDLTVQVIPNGINTQRFRPPDQMAPGQPIVAWVGRGTDLHQKRIDRLAEIAPRLHRAGFRLWIADPAGPDKVIPEVARVLKPIAEYWGKVSPDRMPAFYQDVSASGGCLLSTSRFEGLSIAQLEAQACGCVAIGPDLAGTNEAVRPEHGGILYPDDAPADQVASMIEATLNDREQMQSRQAASRRLIESQFNDDAMTRSYLQIYEQAPFARQRGWRSLVATYRCSPYVDFQRYREYRWTAGHSQYLASLELKQTGDRKLASRVALESLQISPTLFARWRRVCHLGSLLPPMVQTR